jgi:hypothetical protein
MTKAARPEGISVGTCTSRMLETVVKSDEKGVTSI